MTDDHHITSLYNLLNSLQDQFKKMSKEISFLQVSYTQHRLLIRDISSELAKLGTDIADNQNMEVTNMEVERYEVERRFFKHSEWVFVASFTNIREAADTLNDYKQLTHFKFRLVTYFKNTIPTVKGETS